MDHLLIESTAFILSMAMLSQNPNVWYCFGPVLNLITFGGFRKVKQMRGGWSGPVDLTRSVSSSGLRLTYHVLGGPESLKGVHIPVSTTSTGLNPS